MSIEDIDRSHRVGKQGGATPRQIIVKFTSYRSRLSLYSARLQLKKLGKSNVFVNEDLSRHRSEIFFRARKLLKSSRINGVWTSDGVILVKDRHDLIHRNVQNLKNLSVFE